MSLDKLAERLKGGAGSGFHGHGGRKGKRGGSSPSGGGGSSSAGASGSETLPKSYIAEAKSRGFTQLGDRAYFWKKSDNALAQVVQHGDNWTLSVAKTGGGIANTFEKSGLQFTDALDLGEREL